MLTKETLISMIANTGTINIDIDEEAPELIDELPDFDTISERVKPYAHDTDWIDGRTIVISSCIGRITCYFVSDRLWGIEVDELPTAWYFSADPLLPAAEICKVFA